MLSGLRFLPAHHDFCTLAAGCMDPDALRDRLSVGEIAYPSPSSDRRLPSLFRDAFEVWMLLGIPKERLDHSISSLLVVSPMFGHRLYFTPFFTETMDATLAASPHANGWGSVDPLESEEDRHTLLKDGV